MGGENEDSDGDSFTSEQLGKLSGIAAVLRFPLPVDDLLAQHDAGAQRDAGAQHDARDQRGAGARSEAGAAGAAELARDREPPGWYRGGESDAPTSSEDEDDTF